MAFIQPAPGVTTATTPLQRLQRLSRQWLFRQWLFRPWMAWSLLGLSLLASLIAAGGPLEEILRRFGDLDPAADRQALQVLLAIALPVGALEAVSRAANGFRLRQMMACSLVTLVTLAGLSQTGAFG